MRRIMNAPTVLGLALSAALSAVPVQALAAPPNETPAAEVKVETPPIATAAASGSASSSSPPSSPPPPNPHVKRSTVALVAAGVAVVGSGVGTVFGVLALENKSDYRRNPTYSNSDQGNNDAAYADGAIALAVAAAITSLVLCLTSDPSSDEREPPSASKKRSAGFSASPMVVPHGGGLGARLRF